MTLEESRPRNVFRVIPRTPFDFGNVVPGQGVIFPIAQHIDVGEVTQVSLAARLHAANMGTGGTPSPINDGTGSGHGVFDLAGLPTNGPYVGLVMFADLWTPEDPATDFIVLPGFVTCAFTPQMNAPSSLIVSPPRSLGRYVKIFVMALQAPGTAGPLSATLSVDLILKGGDVAAPTGAYNTYLGYR